MTKHYPTFTLRRNTEYTPWKRLAGKIMVRAVLDVINAPHQQSGREAALYLSDHNIRVWSDAWELSIPWAKIEQVTHPLIYQIKRKQTR